MCAPRWRWRPVSACRWSRRTRCSSCRPTTSTPTRRACASPRARLLANPRRVKRFTREQYFKTGAEMEALFADLPSALANTRARSRAAATSALVLGKPQLPDFPTPEVDGVRMPIEAYFRQASQAGLDERLAALYPDPAVREQRRPEYLQRLEFEIDTIVKMGFPGYFLIVSDFIVWAKDNGCPVGPGPRLGRGLAGGLRALHHRPRPAAVQAAVRALPEPRAGVDARLRHRLLPGQPRPRDRLRQGQVRPRRGEPDRHLRHHGRKAALRDVGRVLGMGYGHVDSVAKLVPGLPGKTYTLAPVPEKPDPGLIYVAQGGARARAARGRRGRGGRAAGAGHPRRGPGAQRRHARRRRADRAGQDHRLLPAVPAARQRQRGEPVRQGRRRGHRPGQVRLPGPGHADHPGAGQGLHPRAPSRAAPTSITTSCRWTTHGSTSSSPTASPKRCSSSKAAACRACCARPDPCGWRT